MHAFSKGEVSAYYQERVPLLRREGTEWRGPCPIHKGKSDSFSVNSETGAAYCHSKCGRGWGIFEIEELLTSATAKSARESVNRIVGRLSDDRLSNRSKRVSQAYPYTDEEGRLLFEVVRYEPKDFRQRRPGPTGQWVWGVSGVRMVPYRLPKLASADTVYIVEGEKDVHSLEEWGLVATCNPGGAGKWRAEFSSHFVGKEIIVLPDNDDAGEKHAAAVVRSLSTVARSARVVRLPGLGAKEDVSDWKRAGGTLDQLMAYTSVALPMPPDAPAEPPRHAKRFRTDEKGVYLIDHTGGKQDRWICPPLEIVARVRDFNGEGWGLQLRFENPEGDERFCVLTFAALAGDGKDAILRLLDLGFRPQRDRASIEALKDYIYQSNPARLIRAVNRIGWHHGAFVLPDRSFGAPANHDVVFESETPVDHKYHVAGTLAEWRESVGRLSAANTKLIFALSCAFAGPLIDLVKGDGFGIHFRGLSSTGKTTLLLAAGSVWGGTPQGGFLYSWRSTANGMESRAALHNDGVLCLDEIGEVRDVELGEIVYALGNGTGKSRMTRAISSRANTQFKLLFLSTGERSMADVMRSAGHLAKGGQEVRLVEVSADAGAGTGVFECFHEFSSGDQLARALSRFSRSYYGTPIRAFLEEVASRRDDLQHEVRQMREAFIRRAPKYSGGEVVRVAGAFGMIAAAGEIASRMGITGWTAGAAIRAAEKSFDAWLEGRGTLGSRDVESGISAVRDFIQVNGASRFQSLSDKETKMVNRAGFKSREGGEWEYFVLPSVFKDELCRGYDYKEIAKEMIRRGYLRKGEGTHLTVRKRIEEIGNSRLFALQPRFMNEDEREVSAGTVGTFLDIYSKGPQNHAEAGVPTCEGGVGTTGNGGNQCSLDPADGLLTARSGNG